MDYEWVPKGFKFAIVCDNATQLPLGFYIVDDRDKLTATEVVLHLMARLPCNRYHVYTSRVRVIHVWEPRTTQRRTQLSS